MDFQLTEQQRRMVAAVRDLAQGEFKANAQKYMDGTFPWENMKKLADIGVLGMSVPEEYGGLGLPVFDTALVLEEIAKTCYVTAMATLGEAGVQTRVIATYAPSGIRERILPKVVSGDCMLAVCMTEPHAGTDVANYRTNAVIRGDRVILNGTKTLISRAREAGMFVIFTRIDGKPGREGIGCVLLEPDTPGFEVTGTYHTMGGENLHEIETARSILYRACITANPFPDPFMAAVAKITCNEMSNRVTSEAIQMHGGFGFTDEYAVSRLYRGARYGTLGGGTSETLRDLIGKRIMDAAETGAELLAYDMMNGAGLAACGINLT